jgi:integrase
MMDELPEWDDVSVYYDRTDKRWLGSIPIGYDGTGRRLRKRFRSYRSEGDRKGAVVDLKKKFQEYREELETGVVTPADYTIERCVEDWLDAVDLDEDTIAAYRGQAEKWIYPRMGEWKLKRFRAKDAQGFFNEIASSLGKRSLLMIKSTLRRSIRQAQVRDLIGKNVVELVTLPRGRPGRPSRAMTEQQTQALFKAAKGDRLEAAVEIAVLLAVRPGELRGMCWDHVVAWDERKGRWVSVKVVGWDHDRFAVQVWTTANKDGRLKREWTKRTLELPRLGAAALRKQWERQEKEREGVGSGWADTDRVFTREDGSEYTKEALGYYFAKITKRAGLGHWRPNESRHTGVSIMSNNGVKIQDISDAVGHKGTHVTETVYRHVIAPAVKSSASVMDGVFGKPGNE